MITSPFICVKITPEMIAEAEKRNLVSKDKYGTKGTRLVEKNDKIRQTGYIGEQIVKHAFSNLEFSTSDDYDLVYLGKKFDVKSVGCNSFPEPFHVGTVFNDETKKDIDFYIFTRIKNDNSLGWITGFISKDDFFKKADTIKAGTKNNNFTYEHNRYTIEYGKCIRPVSVFRGKK